MEGVLEGATVAVGMGTVGLQADRIKTITIAILSDQTFLIFTSIWIGMQHRAVHQPMLIRVP